MIRVKGLRLLYAVVLCLLIFQPGVFSQTGSIVLDEVEGINGFNQLVPGETIKFKFRLTNNTYYSVLSFTNGFRIYSPDGANWQPIVLDTFNLGWSGYFPLGINFGSSGVTGEGADTVAIGGDGYASTGFPNGFDEQVWYIETMVDAADAGKHICIDSSFCPISCYWLWNLSNNSDYSPAWSGEMCFEIAGGDGFYTISSVYENIEDLEGEEIRVLGEYVSPDVSILVASYNDYLKNHLMPMYSDMNLTGILPEQDYWYGGMMIVTGVVTSAPDPYPAYDIDTLEITIDAVAYEYLSPGWGLPVYTPPVKDSRTLDKDYDADCDSCKFALLVASGGRDRYDRPDYWKNLVELWRHKIDNENYCSTNVFVHFDVGNAEDPDEIPHASVDSCTQSRIDSSHQEIARRIAGCRDKDKKSTVQKMFTNHGADDSGVVLVGGYLSPDECKDMQQKLIDSCCAYLYDEFITCFGGDMLNGLKGLDNKKKTQIHTNSDAPDDMVSWSPVIRVLPNGDTVYVPDRYLERKIASLAAGNSYEVAVRDGETAYLDFLRNEILPELRSYIQRLKAFIAAHPHHPDIADVQAWLDETILDTLNINSQLDDIGCPSWVRHTFKEYCEYKELAVRPGGRLELYFQGIGGCGNVTVYEKTGDVADATWKRIKIWNWNLPGSSGYSENNEYRVLHVPDTSSGIYRVHNDNGEFTVDAESFHTTVGTEESPSNPLVFAGFSVGFDDESSAEFYPYSYVTHWAIGIDTVGFNLVNVPAIMSPYEGIERFIAQYYNITDNDWWSDMELYMDILTVIIPGTLVVRCQEADNPEVSVEIESAGEYVIDLGGIVPDEDGNYISFDASEGVSFEWDSWGLRTKVPTWSEYYCGVYNNGYTGNVDCSDPGEPDISDITRLIDYLYLSHKALCCLPEADVNGSGGEPDISDITRLIDHLYITHKPLELCPDTIG
ncbi:MAG: hypothetical protein JXA92_06335 [candidate division Zixibacteria bacterium]|nr:hypothetical protein [candidate division Zixibacteria bacterium]